ncbi:MAG: AMP-binding protein [Deltaproteobacteria bacterium]|nr:AMP-binding protein [Deltaproteobacteria bacterium]MBW2661970.1 AMP-binding protein [Deltaproteobacteria bacterium]
MVNETGYQNKPWIAHYGKNVPETLEYEETHIVEFLERSAEKFPDKTALNFQGYKVSYCELNDMVNRFAACINDFGIKKGERAAILLPNLIPCVVSYYAILKIGAIAVMNNPLYADRELLHQFNDSGSKILITLDLLGNRMIDLRPKTKIKQIIYTSIGDYLPFPKKLLFKLVAKKKKLAADVKSAYNLYKWKDVLAKCSSRPHPVDISFDNVAMYQYTGGTTGVSKGVLHVSTLHLLKRRWIKFLIEQT